MNRYNFDPTIYKDQLNSIITKIEDSDNWHKNSLHKILVKSPKDGNSLFSRDQILAGYRYLVENELKTFKQAIHDKIKMKPTRTISGVAPITVLTKPFPCPGTCIFCPNDIRMPKSYIADEPGAQRAEMNKFDPYLQTYNRLKALASVGHNVEKVELIVLGGTWSFYPESYQIWFIKRCFDAMNDFGIKDERSEVKTTNIYENFDNNKFREEHKDIKSYNAIINKIKSSDKSNQESVRWEELFEAHKINEDSKSRCVGLVLETRPDHINAKEVIRLRKLGATKIQIGIQSLNDDVLLANKRGHNSKQTAEAIKLLRLAGFKIHGHFMPNLYKATVQSDIEDYKKLWTKDFEPDELKIYPTSIIENTELNELYKEGKYQPYTYNELLEVLINTIPNTPRYCRLTRIIRDIPSTDIVAGNKLTNFRQIVENKLNENGNPCKCIRCREIKSAEVTLEDLELEIIPYETSIGNELFLSYKTIKDDKIAGFLRLSLPNNSSENFIDELKDLAMIREVHVYGQVVGIGKKTEGKSQHVGLGTLLIEKAKEIAKGKGFKKIAVISAIGTRNYYRKKGFELDDLYMSSSI